MFYKIIIVLFSLSITSCKCQEQTKNTPNGKENKMVQEENILFEEVYFQRWVAGIQGGGAGITVNLNVKKPLDKAITLTKLQLKVYETTTIEKIDDLHYIARINTHTNDLKLDEDPKKEYGNEIPLKSDINLKEGQVKIFFTKNGKSSFQLVEDVQEKEMLAYPSMRPQNDEEKTKELTIFVVK